MGVDVDKTGGDQLAFCVDFLSPAAADRPHGGDPVALDRYVCLAQRRAGSIGQRAAANDEIILRGHDWLSI